MVGRPREFDVDEVLDAAMHAFWARGYEATSLRDLMEATGLHKGSLYQAFGDKHQLFLRALERYLAEMRRQKTEMLATASTPLEALSLTGHAMIEIADADASSPKGCMALNTLVELAPHDPQVQRIMMAHVDSMRRSLEEVVAAAQAAGELRTQPSPAAITQMMMTFMSGIGANLKGILSKEEAHALFDQQIEMFR